MSHLPRLLAFLILISLSSMLFWIVHSKSDIQNHHPNAAVSSCELCKENDTINKLLEQYSTKWTKQEANFQKFRSLLRSNCNAISMAVVTQVNTPLGSKITYDAEKQRSLEVKPDLFSIFLKEQPFGNASWESCAVVGNAGILTNSSCGKDIDSAEFVIRCNLPPLEHGYVKDVGNKTHFVTANPTILINKYKGLTNRRLPFFENMHAYGDSMILLPAFSFGQNTAVSLRVLYTLEDFKETGLKTVFFNPEYLRTLAKFWHGQGLRSPRPSTGFMMATLALELCANVHLYGFWPFSLHPHTYQHLNNHYYDNQQSNKRIHSMPTEFSLLMKLHAQGVIHLHLGECPKR